MTPRELEEYRALRDTIRERGTARLWIAVIGLAVWTALTLAAAALGEPPASSLVTLLFLVAVFEVIFSVHTAVERVGRYIQVFYEAADEAARWEHTAMAFGPTSRGAGPMDALFSPLFLVATLFNLLPTVVTAPVPVEWIVIGIVHVLFVVRIAGARRASAKQRAVDLQRFREMRAANGRG